MATLLCQKCKQAHPGRVCDYDEQGECAETIDTKEATQPSDAPSKDEVGARSIHDVAELVHKASLPH